MAGHGGIDPRGGGEVSAFGIYMDGRRIGERVTVPPFQELLANPEIEVRFKRPGSPLMHLKSYQIDGRWLRTGAANFSASGLKRQEYDLLVIDSQVAAEVFKAAFRSDLRASRNPASRLGGAEPVFAATFRFA